jgi:putative membrane-bound dehydrogenase-like protein
VRAVPLLLLLAACSRRDENGPLAPAAELSTFRFSDDFRAELFAAEPDVVDPVDMAFDEYGRAYVAELLDLPFDPPAGKTPRSRIRMLEDTDGDGRADRSVVFAEGVLQTSGLMPWKGGLIVTSAPNIYYFRDTNGDGRADERKVLFTGFWRGNPEAEITNPRLGLDNWIYFSNSGNPGLITSPEHPHLKPIQVRGADFRYHPVRGLAETASGPAQFGSTFDDWGNRFISQNTIHLRHVILPMHYLARAPLASIPAVAKDIYAPEYQDRRMFPLTRPQQWRVERTKLRRERYKETKPGYVEQVAGYITGASGGTVYTGDWFPPQYRGTIFTADVSGNLVRHDLLRPEGVTFSARPAKDAVEFLASTDPWFRPTSFANAPDGALYITDMYREFIETPLSIPEELQKQIDFYSGDTLGRIWRLEPNRAGPRRPLRVDLGRASSGELVKQLENANGWHRATAQRLLVERQDRSVAPLLREIAAVSALPQASLRALWTLEGIGALEADDILQALQDAQPRIREHAVRLSESLPPGGEIARALLARRRDSDIRVRFQLALTLGGHTSAAARAVLAELALEHGEDPWFRSAILTSSAAAPGEMFRLLAAHDETRIGEMMKGLAELAGARRNPPEVARLIAAAETLSDPVPALVGLARGLRLAGGRPLAAPGAGAVLASLMEDPSEAVIAAAWGVAGALDLSWVADVAPPRAMSAATPVAIRAAAAGALRAARFAEAAAAIRRILASQPPPEVQVAAVEALGTFSDPGVPAALLEHWRVYSPAARARVVAALLNQRDRVPALLAAVESGRVEPSALDLAARNRLIEFPDPAVAARARKLIQASGGDRAQVVAAYKDVVALAGDASRGKLVFEKHCAECHLPRRAGARVGPDLSGVNNKTREELLASILDPSAAIESRYVNYLVTTKDGRLHDGVLLNETPSALTLRNGLEDVTILRANLAEIRASSVSLMPEDLEKTMTKQELADVIRYLRGGL